MNNEIARIDHEICGLSHGLKQLAFPLNGFNYRSATCAQWVTASRLVISPKQNLGRGVEKYHPDTRRRGPKLFEKIEQVFLMLIGPCH
jgi:hypothetical protein